MMEWEAQAQRYRVVNGVRVRFYQLLAMQRLSFPNGIGPFVDGVTKLMTSTSGISADMPKTAPQNSESSTTSLPAQFSASLQMDTPGMLHGRARRAN